MIQSMNMMGEKIMKIIKKFQCKKCNIIIEENGVCECGNLVVKDGKAYIKEGILGLDVIDLSQQLLNE